MHLQRFCAFLALALSPLLAGADALQNGDFNADLTSWLPGASARISVFRASDDANNSVSSGSLGWNLSGTESALNLIVATQCTTLDEGELPRRAEGALRLSNPGFAVTGRIAVAYYTGAACDEEFLTRSVLMSTRASRTWKRGRLYQDSPLAPLVVPAGAASALYILEIDADHGPVSGRFDALAFGPPAGEGSRNGVVDGFDYAVSLVDAGADAKDAHGQSQDLAFEFHNRGWRSANTSSTPVGDAGAGHAGVFHAFDGHATSYVGIPWQVTNDGDISYWVVSPEVNFSPTRPCISLHTRAEVSNYGERAQIRASTSGSSLDVGVNPNTVGDFDLLLADINPTESSNTRACSASGSPGYPREWCEIRACGMPSTGSGRVAFRYFVHDVSINGGYIGIDRFRFPSPAPLSPTALTITGVSPVVGEAGQPIGVSLAISSPSGTPTGDVIIGDGVDSCVAPLSGGGVGSCQLVRTTAGTQPLQAHYAGDSARASAKASRPHTVLPASDGVTPVVEIVSQAPNPSQLAGQFLVKVRVTSPLHAPTGSVVISADDQTCVAVLDPVVAPDSLVQQAECWLSLYASGNYDLRATYLGDYAHRSAIVETKHQVSNPGPTPSTVVVVSDLPDSSAVGQTYRVVVDASGANLIPSGRVSIREGNRVCSTLLVEGRATCDMRADAPGLKTLMVLYWGDSHYASSSTTEQHMVHMGSTPSQVAILSDAPDPTVLGETYFVFAKVTGANGVPSGTVTVTDGNSSCEAVLSAGEGSCALFAGAVGPRMLQASYPGDATYASSISPQESHTNVPANTIIFRNGFEF